MELRHWTVVSGTANEKQFRSAREGVGRPNDDKLSSMLKSNSGLLHILIPMHRLNIVAIFGHPTYSINHEDTSLRSRMATR